MLRPSTWSCVLLTVFNKGHWKHLPGASIVDFYSSTWRRNEHKWNISLLLSFDQKQKRNAKSLKHVSLNETQIFSSLANGAIYLFISLAFPSIHPSIHLRTLFYQSVNWLVLTSITPIHTSVLYMIHVKISALLFESHTEDFGTG